MLKMASGTVEPVSLLSLILPTTLHKAPRAHLLPPNNFEYQGGVSRSESVDGAPHKGIWLYYTRRFEVELSDGCAQYQFSGLRDSCTARFLSWSKTRAL